MRDDSSKPDAPPPASADDQRLKTLDKLAEGGMSLVFKAEEIRLKKMTGADAAPTESVRPADPAASAVSAGDTLRDRLRRGPLRLDEVLPIAVWLAETLVVAQDRGGGPYDVTPERVLLAPDGSVHLAPGAGTSGADVDGAAASRHGMEVLPYMSPERAAGRSVDHRSAIFSVGAIIFEMATGRAPFTGRAGVDTLQAILHDPPPLDRLPEGPAELRRILGKALEKERDERYQSSRDFYLDLKRLRRDAESGAVSAASSGMMARLKRLVGKKP